MMFYVYYTTINEAIKINFLEQAFNALTLGVRLSIKVKPKLPYSKGQNIAKPQGPLKNIGSVLI